MPIKKENRARYPKDWKQIRARILERAKHRCENCGVPNYAVITRSRREVQYVGKDHDDAVSWIIVQSGLDGECSKLVVVVLTIAHVHDHRPENCDEKNLAAWCQRCHNRHDGKHRRTNAAETRLRKSGPLLFELEPR